MMDYLKPLLFLAGLIILFHVVFIWLWPQGKRFWKRVDYWWVSFGVIGILGATFTLRKEVSHAWQPFHRMSLASVYELYQKDLRYEASKFSDSASYVTNVIPDSLKRKVVLEIGDSLMALSKLVDSARGLIVDKDQFDLVDTITMRYLRYGKMIDRKAGYELAGIPEFWGQRIREEVEEIQMLKSKENRDTLNWLLLVLSPYLFAGAMAIRLTKVTAEIRELKVK